MILNLSECNLLYPFLCYNLYLHYECKRRSKVIHVRILVSECLRKVFILVSQFSKFNQNIIKDDAHLVLVCFCYQSCGFNCTNRWDIFVSLVGSF